MIDIVKRTSIGALILLIMPLSVWLSGWRWQPDEPHSLYSALYWLTETATRPWAVLTSAVLCGWFLWCLRFRLRPALVLLTVMISAILLGQYSNSSIKQLVKEPRPYVLWLKQTYGVDSSTFYQQKRSQRSKQVSQLLADNTQLPVWLKQHWAFETGYAFPSGHSMFAASWALLSVGLLWQRRHYKTVTALMLWAGGVMGSRLMLGMHWPWDLVAATLVSWLLVTVASWCVQRWSGPLTVPPAERQEIEEREGK